MHINLQISDQIFLSLSTKLDKIFFVKKVVTLSNKETKK